MTRPFDVTVECGPEPVGVAGADGRREPGEEDEAVVGLERVRRHLLVPPLGAALLGRPVRVRRGPAPEPRAELAHVHVGSVLRLRVPRAAYDVTADLAQTRRARPAY